MMNRLAYISRRAWPLKAAVRLFFYKITGGYARVWTPIVGALIAGEVVGTTLREYNMALVVAWVDIAVDEQSTCYHPAGLETEAGRIVRIYIDYDECSRLKIGDRVAISFPYECCVERYFESPK